MMQWVAYIISLILLGASGLLAAFSPNRLSMLVVAVMLVLSMAGCTMGIMPLYRMIVAFRHARRNIKKAREVQTESTWITISKEAGFFEDRHLDQLFDEYKEKAAMQRKSGILVSDITLYIDEEYVSTHAWHGVAHQVPGTLTGLGLLGTFVGLIRGVGGIGFSSVEAAVSSIQRLLSGTESAFYTSIAGVILSILFNLFLEFSWNLCLRELSLFVADFHAYVQPSAEEQQAQLQHRQFAQILERLDRIPKAGDFSLSNPTSGSGNAGSEKLMMPQILAGLRNKEFVFYLQPRYDLNSKKLLGGEALVRWNHSKLGLVSPSVFMPVLESNGYITKLDQYIWEMVFMTIRDWISAGIRPVPLSINISKTDVLAIDVVEFFSGMLQKYRIPPRFVELEIAETAYLMTHGEVAGIEEALRQMGFRVVLDGFKGDFFELANIEGGVHADIVKLDLRSIAAKGNNAISGIFAQAQHQKLQLSVEGVETMEQLSLLRKCGCTEGQGYYFSKPVPVRDFETKMQKE